MPFEASTSCTPASWTCRSTAFARSGVTSRQEPAGLRFEVPLRKRSAGAGLQVALEAEGGLLVSKLDNDVKLPGTIPCRVRTAAFVVVHQSGGHIGRDTHAEACPRIDSLEDVDEASAPTYGGPQGKSGTSVIGPETLEFCRGAVNAAQFLRTTRTERLANPAYFALDWPVKIDQVSACGEDVTSGPPSRPRRHGAASLAWLAEPKLTLRR